MQLRNMTLYSIFVRNFGGTFAAVEADLPRIRALGADAIWLLPIHPIGREKRKGSLGSPPGDFAMAKRWQKRSKQPPGSQRKNQHEWKIGENYG